MTAGNRGLLSVVEIAFVSGLFPNFYNPRIAALASLAIRGILLLHQDEGWRLLHAANRGKVVSKKVGCGR